MWPFKRSEYTLTKNGKIISFGKYNMSMKDMRTSEMHRLPNGIEVFPQNIYVLSVVWKEQMDSKGSAEGFDERVELNSSADAAEVDDITITLLKENPDGSITVQIAQNTKKRQK